MDEYNTKQDGNNSINKAFSIISFIVCVCWWNADICMLCTYEDVLYLHKYVLYAQVMSILGCTTTMQ